MAVRLSDKPKLRPARRYPDQLAALLSRQIASGALPPGAKLPSEAALAARFRVSRSVVREALSQLKYEGLLVSRQGLGVTVVGEAGRRSFRVGEAGRLKPAELADAYEMRAILEAEAAALAALRRTPAQLKRLSACLRRMACAVERDADGTEDDLAFHQEIAAMSGNRVLRSLMEFLHSRLREVIRTARAHSRRTIGLPRVVQQEHEAIFAAVAAGDAEGARRSCLEHLQNAARRLSLSRGRRAEPGKRIETDA
ncbi:MAG: FCD domain-containing protein [Desulfobacterales bacterium]